MKKNNMVGYNVSLYDCPNPQEFWNVAKPKNCIDSIWIPQTIGDQIWMWFEFANEDDKNEYIRQICEICNFKIVGYYDNIDAQGYKTRKKQTTSIRKIYKESKDWFNHFTQSEINHWTINHCKPHETLSEEENLNELILTLKKENLWNKFESIVIGGVKIK